MRDLAGDLLGAKNVSVIVPERAIVPFLAPPPSRHGCPQPSSLLHTTPQRVGPTSPTHAPTEDARAAGQHTLVAASPEHTLPRRSPPCSAGHALRWSICPYQARELSIGDLQAALRPCSEFSRRVVGRCPRAQLQGETSFPGPISKERVYL
jgi:hypothetical protein